MSEDIVITEANFGEYFKDVRKYQPEKGQVLARYAAVAELIDGALKRDLIDILCLHEQSQTVVKLMKKIGCATELDSVSVPLAMARDLLEGMTPEQVAQKSYRFVCEAFFYTKKEYIPTEDPHWTCVSIHNLDEFLDAGENRLRMQARILNSDEIPQDLSTYAHHEAGSTGETGLNDSQADTGPIIDCEEHAG